MAFSCDEVDTSHYLYDVRPAGTPCQNPQCPYNDIAYFKNLSYHGRCLNCIDDMRKAEEELSMIL